MGITFKKDDKIKIKESAQGYMNGSNELLFHVTLTYFFQNLYRKQHGLNQLRMTESWKILWIKINLLRQPLWIPQRAST